MGARRRRASRPTAIAVGIETPARRAGRYVDRAGLPASLRSIPKQLDRFRDRFTAARRERRPPRCARGRRCACAPIARAFRAVRPDDPAIIQLRELCRIVEDLQERGRPARQSVARAALSRRTRAWLTLSPAADEPWLWTLLAATPDPAAWPQLPRRRIAPALRAHRIRRLTADDVVTALRQPRLTVAPGVAEAVATRIASLVPQLVLVHEQRTDGASARSIGCWNAGRGGRPPRASRASIVTSRFSSPCQASEEW